MLTVVFAGCQGEDPVAARIAELQGTDRESRIAAADALRELGEPAATAVPALTSVLGDLHPGVRQSAARALGHMGDAGQSAVPPIEDLLDDPELSVRMAAAWSLRELDPAGEKYVPVLIKAMREGEGGTIVAVGNLGPDGDWAVPTLTTLLQDRRPGVRRLAAEALGKIGPDAAARTALERAARDSDDRVREAATAALHAG
ncbi:MAG: HEAT repeat domain-containing protein [Planctomycetaceae bacterium]|nr:HEAT repeat domain-containing protein [Planctomycetaceae bacterium]